MSGTLTLADLGESLLADCRRRADGSLQYDGERPGEAWWAHGYLTRHLVVVIGGAPQQIVLHKARWIGPSTGHTVHSRPPGELGAIRFCALIVFAELYDWLDGPTGAVTRDPTCAPISPSPRTLQRWLRRALPHVRTIRPFGVDDARSYMRYHLQRADASPDLFNDAAIQALFRASRGHPRIINQLATQALIDGAVAGHDAIGLPLIRDLLAAHPLHPQARP